MSRALIAVRPRLHAMLEPLLGSLQADTVAADGDLPAGVSVLLQTAMDPMDAARIDAAPGSLRLIANLGVGYDNIDLHAARERGIAVSNTPVVAEDTADLAFALLLAAARRLSPCERLLREGSWDAAQSVLGSRVHGKILGIVGFGAIGQAVARRAAGFSMQLHYHGPREKPAAAKALGARYVADLKALLGECDFVSLHCPLTEHSRHLINTDTLAAFKAGATLVNTGRGPLIDEQALLAALREGRLGAAGLDVFEHEPRVTEGLLELDNVTLLPHIGSATGECRMDMVQRGLANIARFLESGEPLDRVD